MDVMLRDKAEELAKEIALSISTQQELSDVTRLMTKSVIERMLDAEMDVHLGQERGRAVSKAMAPNAASRDVAQEPAAETSTAKNAKRSGRNRRNGNSVKTVQGESGRLTIYVALGVNLTGHKELLGLWLAESEGAKFWLHGLTDLKNRGLADIFVACVDGLAGFPDAIRAAYPQTKGQLCVVHLVRAALRYVADKDSKAVIADLKKIYQAATLVAAEQALEAFAQAWQSQDPTIVKVWRAK
jgi:transposase-like protein